MSAIFSGDFQAAWENLDLCDKAWKEIIQIATKYKLSHIFLLGDLKQVYNPVDARVVIWWQNKIRSAVKNGFEVVVLLGNHDRVGAYSGAGNWLPILKRAGAKVFDAPGCVITDENTYYLLPFTSVSETRHNAVQLRKMHTQHKNDILLFHQDIQGCSYNNLGGKSDGSLTRDDVHASRYRFAIGGHIHLPQRIENTYYVGSPFCQDWGEVNQRKRYLVIRKGNLESHNSQIPGWYDPSANGFVQSKPRVWTGSRVRITISCDASQDYGKRIERVRRVAEKEFRGADIYVQPKFLESKDEGTDIKIEHSDRRKIAAYVAANMGSVDKRYLVKYMLEKLAPYEAGLSASNIKFIKAKGKNFLSYKNIELDLTQKGLTLIQGINEDRNKKSNGSGKTSLVQLLPVALFGRTFKDQQSDHWANRWIPKKKAYAELVFRNGRKQKIRIVRGRRPPSLQMWVDGKEQSSGMKSNERTGTQEQIERITGYSWQTLANAVYIDRAVSDSFLSGTKKQRTDILSRFQNLERFEHAQEAVKADSKELKEKLETCSVKLAQIRATLEEKESALHSIQSINKDAIRKAKKALKKAKRDFKKHENKALKLKLQYKANDLKNGYGKFCKEVQKKENELAVLHNLVSVAHKEIYKWEHFPDRCGTCNQPMSKVKVEAQIEVLKKHLKKLKGQEDNVRVNVTAFRQELQILEGLCDTANAKIKDIEDGQLKYKIAVQSAQSHLNDLMSDSNDTKLMLHRYKNEIKDLKEYKESLKSKLTKLSKKMHTYFDAIEAFSRDGIPAFLNRQLCPVLNKAADYYSELFSDREIQLQFVIEKGGFVPKIINSKGGAEIEDQSTGERALAGLVASFSLREAAPKSNILILDEPGEGLDAQTARQFANSLHKLERRFGAIYIATHNVHILSELENVRTVTVRKKNKISRLEIA